MDVELIHNKEPGGLRIGGNGLGDMPRKVFFCSAGPDGGRHDFPSRHVEVGDQALRPVADVFILRALDQTWLHRQGGSGPLQRLDPVFSSVLMTCPPCLATAGACWYASHTATTWSANAPGSSGLALSQYSTRCGCKST